MRATLAAQDSAPPPERPTATQTQDRPQSMDFRNNKSQAAPAVRGKDSDFQLPEGNQWRYSEFVNAVQAGKVERVRFSKEGGQLQARPPAPPLRGLLQSRLAAQVCGAQGTTSSSLWLACASSARVRPSAGACGSGSMPKQRGCCPLSRQLQEV